MGHVCPKCFRWFVSSCLASERFIYHRLSFARERVEMRLPLKALCVDLPEGLAANQPLFATTFSPPIGASFPGALVSVAMIGSPARSDSFTASGESFCNFTFCSGLAETSMRV